MTAARWCGSCLRITRAGDSRPRLVPAAYLWLTAAGSAELLCVSCCACWRENAAADPSLLPARVSSL